MTDIKRGDETRLRLMHAFEALVAEHGFENVTVRAILQAADQKNESALQYHFKNRQGLCDAVLENRNTEVRAKREQLASEIRQHQAPTMRQLCWLMVIPSFLLARKDVGFRNYIKGFGPRLAHAHQPLDMLMGSQKNEFAKWLLEALRSQVPDIEQPVFQLRLQSALKFSALIMSDQAAVRGGFSGRKGDLFVSNLVDMLVGMLGAHVSEETVSYLNKT